MAKIKTVVIILKILASFIVHWNFGSTSKLLLGKSIEFRMFR